MLERSGVNRLNTERRPELVRSLVEGNSMRAVCRMTDTAGPC
jgi:hypothetical protein